MAVRIPSELGRTEFVMVALARDGAGYVAHPLGKGSGAVSAVSQADSFIAIDALADALPAGTSANVRLFSAHVRVPDLVIMGSHCNGLDAVAGELMRKGVTSRILALGSLGGLAALKRGECDIAPIHLMDPDSGIYNTPFRSEGLDLIRGWRRMQGLVYRNGGPRFDGRDAALAVAAVLADADCIMVNCNRGAGTRVLIDLLLKGMRPAGYLEPASLAQRSGCKRRTRSLGLGCRDTASRKCSGPRIYPAGGGALRLRGGESLPWQRSGRGGLDCKTGSTQRLRHLGFDPNVD